jgi:hypothetical protein
LELIAKNVVVNANIESQSLFDAAGNAVPSANYEYLPFDKTVGHEQLLILWDDREGDESQNFAAALASAQTGLQQVPASFRGQNTATRPIPIVPRNAAIKLRFSEKLSIDASFFAANPEAVQLLEFKGDPGVVSPVDAFRILPSRVLVNNDALIVDTTILAGEAGGVIGPIRPMGPIPRAIPRTLPRPPPGPGHAFAESSISQEIFLQPAQLAIEQVVRLVDQADGDVRHDFEGPRLRELPEIRIRNARASAEFPHAQRLP